jgi:hypothetical protein
VFGIAEFAQEGKRFYGARCRSIKGKIYFFMKRSMAKVLGKIGMEKIKGFGEGIN